jgi:hypothetical protein
MGIAALRAFARWLLKIDDRWMLYPTRRGHDLIWFESVTANLKAFYPRTTKILAPGGKSTLTWNWFTRLLLPVYELPKIPERYAGPGPHFPIIDRAPRGEYVYRATQPKELKFL